MKDIFLNELLDKKNEGYSDSSEYIADEFKHKFYFLKDYLKHQKNNELQKYKEEILKNFHDVELVMEKKLRLTKNNSFFATKYVKEIFKLNKLEWFTLVIAMMAQADDEYLKLILEIEKSRVLTYNAILKVYFFVSEITQIKDYYNILSSLSEKMNLFCFMDGRPEIDKRLFENIMSNAESDINISGLNMYIPSSDNSKELIIREDIPKNMVNFLKNSKLSNKNYFYIHGENGIGKKTIVKRTCSLKNKGIIEIDIEKLMEDEMSFTKYVLMGCREAYFIKGYVCLFNIDKILKKDSKYLFYLKFAINTAAQFSEVVFLVSDENINLVEKMPELKYIEIPLCELNNDESFKLWDYNIKNLNNKDSSVDAHELANKFNFTPKQIKNTILSSLNQSILTQKNKINKRLISSCAYKQVTSNLSDKATLIEKKHSWDELILNSKEKEIIKKACDQIRYRHIVYDKWGMNKRVLYGKGLSMLFAGPSGTGKTMAAQVVANELELEIYKVDLSQVISKYIGESEKNLGEVFDNAKKSNVILLFDETDAIFAKRTEVKDSHDRNSNVETSYLLQKMEEYNGITIMTTNFLENIDKAFFRRISYVVHFAFPNSSARKEIWKNMYPSGMPLSKDVDFNFLSNQFEISGGSIKNIAVNSAFMAAAENKKVEMKHIIKAVEYEIKKQGKMVSKSDFGEYSYML